MIAPNAFRSFPVRWYDFLPFRKTLIARKDFQGRSNCAAAFDRGGRTAVPVFVAPVIDPDAAVDDRGSSHGG